MKTKCENQLLLYIWKPIYLKMGWDEFFFDNLTDSHQPHKN
jgi:hypothetical protein